VGQEKKLFFGHSAETPFSCGENSLTDAKDNTGSTAPYFGMSRGTEHLTLSDRLTQSLISAGLVRGIIPTSIRKRSGQQILDIAFFGPDGGSVD
jgi:hypothetical protein